MSAPRVRIHYRRPPSDARVFEQALLEEHADHTVTLLERTPLPRPVQVDGAVVLDPGASVVWFTYPGLWYDIGMFHRLSGEFTGYYANILTPVAMEGLRWETTDLFLDVWLGADGAVRLLDEAEFVEAADRGWIDAPTAAAAREHAETLMLGARQGTWPPAHVREWTLQRARGRLAQLDHRA